MSSGLSLWSKAAGKKGGKDGEGGLDLTDLDDDEESMDWWTKYFASVDAMIEVCTGFIVVYLLNKLKRLHNSLIFDEYQTQSA